MFLAGPDARGWHPYGTAATDPEGRIEPGCGLDPAARGNGHATEAAKALAGWAFVQPGFTLPAATVGEENAPSHAVLRRAGFTAADSGEGKVRYTLSPAVQTGKRASATGRPTDPPLRKAGPAVVSSQVPVIDLGPWRAGGPGTRRDIASRVDEALQVAGFLLVTGHGVDPELPGRIREAARGFFRLPPAAKAPYAVAVGGRGWLGPGAEANSYAEGAASPPDLKESWSCAAEEPTGIAEVDAEWFRPNAWPAEVPELRALVGEYLSAMRALSDELLELLAAALRLETDHFTRHTRHPTWGFNLNWYPGTEILGPPLPGQFRIGAHTDFAAVTVLDRQQGAGGLQIHTDAEGWQDAPYDPAALTVNIGDLMARWTGDRWRAGRHRVLPPPADAPAEELISLVYFYECDPHTRVESLPEPLGRIAHEPVDSHVHLRAQLDAITVREA